MLYRNLPHGGEKISIIGLGTSSLHEAGKAAAKAVETALDAGINYIDLAAAERVSIEAVAAALKGRRKRRAAAGALRRPLRWRRLWLDA